MPPSLLTGFAVAYGIDIVLDDNGPGIPPATGAGVPPLRAPQSRNTAT